MNGDELDVFLTWRDGPAFQPGGSDLPYTASAQLLDSAGNRWQASTSSSRKAPKPSPQ